MFPNGSRLSNLAPKEKYSSVIDSQFSSDALLSQNGLSNRVETEHGGE